ncbi:MAG: RelA/SpoT family protein [Patescibacteria group bacterium]|nr:RelA/SpoT family protein [Patescibacteria group bacterium]
MWLKFKEKLNYLSKQDQLFVKKAYEFARASHQGQKRDSGEDYFIHPCKVALYLTDYKFPKEVIAAGLLHDVLEDTPVVYENLVKKFTKIVADLVDGVSIIGKIQDKANLEIENNKNEKQYLRLQKLILASAKDLRVIFIRLLDRKHNLETLEVFTKKRQRRKAKETLEIYAPLAKRVGMGKLSSELEDMAFAYLNPKIFQQIELIQKEYAPVNLQILKKVNHRIKTILAKNKIKIISVDFRLKHLYSLYHKLLKFDMDINQIYDLAALRIILENKADCYESLGLIHALYQPMIGRIKDYIANPKPNGYQSLHTTVFVKGNKPVEIQIRTVAMHHFAEHGLASHWLYKEHAKISKYKEWMIILKKLMADKSYSLGSIFAENIYAFTPSGEIIELPKNATALDFAYAIHSDLGHKAKHILINNRIRPFDFQLKNSDIVEIKPANAFQVSALWLKKVNTHEAKNKIKSYLRGKDKDLKIKEAKLDLAKKLKFYDINLDLWGKEKLKILKELKVDEESFYLNIYEGVIILDQIIKRFFLSQSSENIKTKIIANPKVIVAGEKTLKVRLSKCCSPKNHDSIVGYISNQKEITIHKKGCLELVRCDKTRIIPAWWEGERLNFEIVALDRMGILFEITRVFKQKNINILDLKTGKNQTRFFTLKVAISRPDVLKLDQVINELSKIKGIKKVIFLK